jgi:pyruvate/2-oxoglutarate dehydrogenase complex dihydrolipoamide acyltransferase (E2) component
MAFTFAMNFDRRVMAGAQAARFFARICDLLRHPDQLTTAPLTPSPAVSSR